MDPKTDGSLEELLDVSKLDDAGWTSSIVLD